jgi:hypothetical protein
MNNQEYFDKAKKDFDLEAETKVAVWTAQSLVELGLLPSVEAALKEFNITQEQYDKYKSLPQS